MTLLQNAKDVKIKHLQETKSPWFSDFDHYLDEAEKMYFKQGNHELSEYINISLNHIKKYASENHQIGRNSRV